MTDRCTDPTCTEHWPSECDPGKLWDGARMTDTPTVGSTPEELAVFIAGEWAASNRALIEASAYTDARVITAGLALADAHVHRAGLGLALFRKLHPAEAAEFENQLHEAQTR